VPIGGVRLGRSDSIPPSEVTAPPIVIYVYICNSVVLRLKCWDSVFRDEFICVLNEDFQRGRFLTATHPPSKM
jgi:hypothetical protein